MSGQDSPRKPSLFKSLGPGIITGAADDDPSGIATYTQAGAMFGTALLWTAIATWPLMAVSQMACARIGMVTGEGLASALERKFPRWVLIAICVALFFANTLNVGADLAAMADGTEMIFGGTSAVYLIVYGLVISWATVELRYSQISRSLQFLALCLLAYVASVFVVGPDWPATLKSTFTPDWPRGATQWSLLVAILGTTISPYLFFWQASEEVEEEKCEGRDTVEKRAGATAEELHARRLDIGIGTFFSNAVMFFIILCGALTLHAHGFTRIETSRQAAEALRPIAGEAAFLLYAIGLLGVGFLAIPTLTGSAAYALAETFGWDQGLDAPLKKARAFYAVILFSMIFAVAFDFSGVNPIVALYWSAVVNGLLAPFILLGVFFVIRDEKIMRGQPSSGLSQTVLGLCTLLMFGAAIGMFVF